VQHVAQIPNSVRRIAEAHRRYRQQIAGLAARNIRVALDEWNYWYGPHVFGELGTRYFLKDALGIAAGLHDDIAQKLAMAKLGLQSLRASVSDPAVSGSLDEQCQLMSQVVEDARSLTFELSNPILYQIGLDAAVEWYLTERIRRQFGIACKFTSEGVRSNPGEDIKVVLFQAVRELLANVVKHARASTIDVRIANTQDALKIVVEDDGVGFDPARIGPYPKQHSGFGLFNIKERLEYLGGNLKIESGARKGVRITMTVPVGTETVDERKEALL